MTTIVNFYWTNRVRNLDQVIDGLLNSSYKTNIIIFNNNPKVSYHNPKVNVINSSFNYGYRAAYMTALLIKDDYFLVVDDDIKIQKDTIKNFMKYAKENTILGTMGKILGDGDSPYTKHKKSIKGKSIEKPCKVDVLIGKGMMFFDRDSLLNMLDLENDLDFDYSREQDILLSMANDSFVIPCEDGQGYDDLGEHGVGYNREKGHYEKRDKLVNDILKI